MQVCSKQGQNSTFESAEELWNINVPVLLLKYDNTSDERLLERPELSDSQKKLEIMFGGE